MEGFPDLEFGDGIDMWVGYDSCLPSHGDIQNLVKFDLASISADQTVITATLRLNMVKSCDSPATYATIETHRTTEDWAENGVTWNNKPDYAGDYGAQIIAHEDRGWYEFDVTELRARMA